MNRVVRVYGTCDDWWVEFTNSGGDLWQCTVPVDTTDGQYACKFYAVDEEGDIGFWCGVLYISSGKVCIELDDDPIHFCLLHESLTFDICDGNEPEFASLTETICFDILGENLIFTAMEECCK